MWVIIVGDNDIDYVNVYGPFESEEAANEIADNYPDDGSGDNNVRVAQIQPSDALIELMAESGR